MSVFQESLISAWLQFSDGSMTPLENYDPAHFTLSATSLDERVVAVRRSAAWKWPTVAAKGEGQGLLLRVEMSPSVVCQTGKRRGVLATGVANTQVRLGQPGDAVPQPGDRRTRPHPLDPPHYGGAISDVATTLRGHAPAGPNGGRLSADNGVPVVPNEFSEVPNRAELPRGRSTERDGPPSRGLTDLEIGMYALLGVFCLAILVFLINCISYTYKYRSKQLSLETPETMPHTHDWVWLGQDGGLCLQQQQQQEEELGGALEEASQLLNGDGQRGSAGVGGGCSSGGRDLSPTTKRKRVKFTTFSNVKSSNGCPVALVQTSDIKWVCPDMELGPSTELRTYMDKLNDTAMKNIV